MKKLIYIFLLLILFISSSIEKLYAQSGWLWQNLRTLITLPIDTSAYRYLPLNVGNRYFFIKISRGGVNDTSIVTCSISYYWIHNNHKYYKFIGEPISGFRRYDTTSGNIYKYDSVASVECRTDSMWSTYGDFTSSCGYSWSPHKCNSDGVPVTILGYSTIEKTFATAYPPPFLYRRFAKNIGLYYLENNQGVGGAVYYTLKGCIVNGILYGDTSVPVGIHTISKLNKSFSLYQNYPNPFNPSTTIKFNIPKSSFVKIVVYDLLGREVEQLLNEEKKPGSYEVKWDGNRFASGVYFYKLITDEFVETKKMLLMK